MCRTCGAAQLHQIFGIGSNAAQYPEDCQHEQGRPYQLALERVREIVELADIIAFEFEARAAAVARLLERPLHIIENMEKNEAAAGLPAACLPLVVELLVLFETETGLEVHLARAERPHLRLTRTLV